MTVVDLTEGDPGDRQAVLQAYITSIEATYARDKAMMEARIQALLEENALLQREVDHLRPTVADDRNGDL